MLQGFCLWAVLLIAGAFATGALAQAPTANSFTYGSIVAYNDGSDQVISLVNLSFATTNDPTSYAVGSSTTSQGGWVSVNPSGDVLYTPPRGYRNANDSFIYTASNASGTSAPATVTLTIGNPSFFIDLPFTSGVAGQAYNAGGLPVQVSGGRAPYSGFSATGLPGGLSMSASGVISGTPTQSGSFSISIQATDSSIGAGPYTGSATVTLTIASGAPTITDVDRDSGPTAGGETIFLTGTNFTGVTAAYFGGVTASIINVDSATSMRVTAPPGSAGTVNVTVQNAYGTSATSPANAYTYIATPAAPTIRSGPPSLSNSSSATFTVSTPPGTGLIGALGAGAFVQMTSPISLTGLADGPYTIHFRSNDRGVPSASTSYTWTVDTTPPAAPVVVTPANGATAGSATPTVSGTAQASSLVEVFIDGASGGTTSADGSGNWSFTPVSALSPGAHSVFARATDQAGNQSASSNTNTFTVPAPPITLSPGGMPSGQIGVAYAQALTASGGTGSYGFGITAGALPPGLSLAAGGEISGTPTGAGSYNFTVTATDNSAAPGPYTGSRAYTINVSSPAFTLTPPTMTGMIVGSTYSQQVTAGGGTAPYTYVVYGGTTLPPGLTLTSTGLLSGVPTAAGVFSFTIAATDSSTGTGAPFAVARGYTVEVAVQAAPVTTDRIAGIPYGTATPINLSANVTGVYSSLAVVTAPLHGGVSVSGSVVTYTPTAGYFGPDSFTFTATGPGGTSAPATVSLTVATPAAPTVANLSGVSIPYGVVGTPIDLSTSITGVHSSIAVATAPAHGTTSVSGDVVTYTPAPGYYGADSFSLTATGPGGTSTPAIVSLTVATPATPTVANRSGVAVPYSGAGTPIDLSTSITGVHSSIAVATAPAHGTISVSGDVVTYTPSPGYYGADSFTFTATGPGGTSAPATVSLTVATPAAPTVANLTGVSVPYGGTGTPIDLSASITGVHSSIAVATAPAHGTTTVAGDVVTYTPASGYYGVDSFTFTATGPGGTSAPATVSVTVGTPPAPTTSSLSGVAVAYASAGTAIDLSGSVSGVSTSLAIGTAPAHGSVSLSGNVATYVPVANYYGPDSFTFTATGPGGTSSPATVSLTVATPPPPVIETPTEPVVTPPATGGGSAPVTVNLGERTEGVLDGFRVTVDARFGSAEVTTSSAIATAQSARAGSSSPQAGEVFQLIYTPAPNFMGEDTVTLVAYGPGGDSAPATFTFQVAGKAPDLTGQVASNASVSFTPTSTLVGGPFQGLRITRAPAFGTATVDGLTLVFTPGAANSGSTSLDYVVELGFGASAAGRIDLVSNAVPGAQALTAQTVQGHPVTVRISDTVGGPFTGAAVTSVSPTTAGTAAISGSNGVYDLTFTPEGLFSGEVEVGFTLSNAAGTTPGTMTVTVAARPDPSQDPDVRGVASSQVTTARRFADTQIDNFQRRLEALRSGGNGSSNGLSLNFGLGGSDDDRDPRTALRRQLGQDRNLDPGALGDDRDREMLGLSLWGDRLPQDQGAVAGGRLNAAPVGSMVQDGASGPSVGVWTSGSVEWGRQDASGARDSRFTTQGVTAGLDVKVTDRLIVGAGLGYGEDKTRIGDNGSISRGKAVTGAAYASWRPNDAWFVDGVVGLSDLDFDSRRWAVGLADQADGYVDGERSGEVRFAAASVGRSLRRPGLTTDLYARLESRDITLDGFTETGGGISALDWDALDQSSVSINLGAAWRWSIESRRYGRIAPSARFEWSRELEDIGAQGVRYADWAASPTYLVQLDDWSRNAVNLDLGVEWSLSERLMLSLGYRGMLGDASSSNGGQIGLKFGW